MNLIRRLLGRRPKPEAQAGDDIVTAARRRLEDDQERRRQVEEDLRILMRQSSNG